MNRNSIKKVLSLILCVVLFAAMALVATGCSGEPASTEKPQESVQPTEIGEGETAFTFTVVDLEGKKTSFQISTNEKTVGAALVSAGLIAGEEGPYGLYVKTVIGITLDYDKDGKYWAFYENDAAATTGVDQTDIIPNASYAFKAE